MEKTKGEIIKEIALKRGLPIYEIKNISGKNVIYIDQLNRPGNLNNLDIKGLPER